MSFEDLLSKVDQAEKALEASERRVAADWRQLKRSWREGWTPGRIVVAGLVTGFFTGRARPLGRAGGGGVLQMITALSGLFAGSSAQVAAGEAEHAAHSAQSAVAASPPAVTQAAPEGVSDIEIA